MFGIGSLEALFILAALWVLIAWGAYWVIRLGVRHGTLDAVRQDRLEEERRRARPTVPRSPGTRDD